MPVDDFVSNPSDNRPFEDVLRTRVSRRGAITAGALSFGAAFIGSTGTAFAKNDPTVQVNFKPVPLASATGPMPSISDDYEYQVLIPWGTPMQPDGPAYSWPQTKASDQENQIGIGHDGMWYYPLNANEGLLCVNHEFGRTTHVLGKAVPETLEDVRIMQAAHGVSIIKVRDRGNKGWQPVKSNKNRRITVNTPVEMAGPVAGSPLLDTAAGNAPAGTLNNCANGYTPWGTYITCEENFNGYFGSSDPDWVPNDAQARYGFTTTGFGYAWYPFDPRFDLANPDYANEENRFGWIVEIDPTKPNQAPVKRTAMGRFKHEGCALTIGRGGRVVGYMGDDQRFDYIYKFVSAKNHTAMLAQGKSPLDEGALYVARFNDDGSGDWLELTIDNPDLAAAFSSQEEVLTYARSAADILGATPMDRPEWTAVSPNQWVYCTLTNNSRRTVPNAANPQAPNSDGHIIRWKDTLKHTGTSFEWEIVLLASDSLGTENAFTDPDGLWIDPNKRLFIQTDGGQPDGMNNQMLVAMPNSTPKRLFSGVTGDEITGIATTPDRKTMFINIQHPGNGDPSLTNFPAPFDGVTIPRDCTIVIKRKDGGVVGS